MRIDIDFEMPVAMSCLDVDRGIVPRFWYKHRVMFQPMLSTICPSKELGVWRFKAAADIPLVVNCPSMVDSTLLPLSRIAVGKASRSLTAFVQYPETILKGGSPTPAAFALIDPITYRTNGCERNPVISRIGLGKVDAFYYTSFHISHKQILITVSDCYGDSEPKITVRCMHIILDFNTPPPQDRYVFP